MNKLFLGLILIVGTVISLQAQKEEQVKKIFKPKQAVGFYFTSSSYSLGVNYRSYVLPKFSMELMAGGNDHITSFELHSGINVQMDIYRNKWLTSYAFQGNAISFYDGMETNKKEAIGYFDIYYNDDLVFLHSLGVGGEFIALNHLVLGSRFGYLYTNKYKKTKAYQNWQKVKSFYNKNYLFDIYIMYQF
jgi:hypothetical protein